MLFDLNELAVPVGLTITLIQGVVPTMLLSVNVLSILVGLLVGLTLVQDVVPFVNFILPSNP